MFAHPFSKAYWSEAAAEVKNVKKLTFTALMVAICIVLGYIPAVPLFGGARITWGFLGRSICAMVCGPVMSIFFGVAEDLLSFFLTGGGGGPFFPGYTLTTVLGCVFYALFFYRAKLTVRRIFLAKLVTNVQNVLLGALWSSILYGKAYLVLASGSALKNLIMLPFQTVILVVLFSALLPVLRQMGLVPKQMPTKIHW